MEDMEDFDGLLASDSDDSSPESDDGRDDLLALDDLRITHTQVSRIMCFH